MAISKLEAARRQLDCSVRLFFNQEDLLAIHTVSRAAFRVLYDIYPTLSNDGFERELDGVIEKIGWRRFNKVSNFLKHANSDPDGEIDAHLLEVQAGIGLCVILYHRLTNSYSPEMRAYDSFMQFAAPEVFDSPSEPQAEGYADFMTAVDSFTTMSHPERMKLGLDLLAFFNSQKEGGNYYWRPNEGESA